MMRYFDIESTKIACWVNSEDFDAQKQTLFFIHGSGGNYSTWAHQYGRLHKKYNIVAVNLPGHGQSEGNGERDVRSYSEWIRKILHGMDLNKPVLVGHSLGSAIGLRFAIDHSNNISGIVCVGGGMKMPVNALFLDFLKTNPAQLPAEIIEMICKFSLAKENRSKFSVPLQKSIALSSVDVLYGDLLTCNNLDLTEDLGNISVPALVVCGAEDKMTPPDLSRGLAAGIKKSQLEIIDGAGHMVMMEKPAEFNHILDEFTASICPAA
ncbi:MAG TPA: alpha/beta hydrolase [Smithella sp.]|nr:alpha/beta hydrolase [Smithella sp.]